MSIEKLKRFARQAFLPYGVPAPALVALYAVLAFCFVSFNQRDLSFTAAQSFAFLDGHVLDFYDFNHQTGPVAYHPATYIVFALWAIPLKVLGFVPTGHELPPVVLLWFKVLTSLVFFATGGLLSKIAQAAEFDARTGGLVTFAWLSSPLACFSQFIFGQYDIFCAFFTFTFQFFFCFFFPPEINNTK